MRLSSLVGLSPSSDASKLACRLTVFCLDFMLIINIYFQVLSASFEARHTLLKTSKFRLQNFVLLSAKRSVSGLSPLSDAFQLTSRSLRRRMRRFSH